jgi:hypothetical protein
MGTMKMIIKNDQGREEWEGADFSSMAKTYTFFFFSPSFFFFFHHPPLFTFSCLYSPGKEKMDTLSVVKHQIKYLTESSSTTVRAVWDSIRNLDPLEWMPLIHETLAHVKKRSF